MQSALNSHMRIISKMSVFDPCHVPGPRNAKSKYGGWEGRKEHKKNKGEPSSISSYYFSSSHTPEVNSELAGGERSKSNIRLKL